MLVDGFFTSFYADDEYLNILSFVCLLAYCFSFKLIWSEYSTGFMPHRIGSTAEKKVTRTRASTHAKWMTEFMEGFPAAFSSPSPVQYTILNGHNSIAKRSINWWSHFDFLLYRMSHHMVRSHFGKKWRSNDVIFDIATVIATQRVDRQSAMQRRMRKMTNNLEAVYGVVSTLWSI